MTAPKMKNIFNNPKTTHIESSGFYFVLCFYVNFINERPLSPWSGPINIYSTHNSNSCLTWAILESVYIYMDFKSFNSAFDSG